MLELLYSDSSGAIQLAAFRRINGRAIEEAAEQGMPRTLAAVMANSAPNAFRQAGADCGWDREALLRWYVARGDSDRRKHRVREWL